MSLLSDLILAGLSYFAVALPCIWGCYSDRPPIFSLPNRLRLTSPFAFVVMVPSTSPAAVVASLACFVCRSVRHETSRSPRGLPPQNVLIPLPAAPISPHPNSVRTNYTSRLPLINLPVLSMFLFMTVIRKSNITCTVIWVRLHGRNPEAKHHLNGSDFIKKVGIEWESCG